MGKKKSVVLMILITIVTVALCALTIFPAFDIPFLVNGLPKSWNPVVLQYDLGSDFGGGYYTYYYPEGVITEADYDSLSEDDKADYVEHKGLYLSKDEDLGIFDSDADDLTGADVTEEFANGFKAAADKVAARLAKKGYSDYSVSVVDDYALRVSLPASEAVAANVLSLFANSDGLVVKKGTENIADLEDADLSDYIKGFSSGVTNGFAYIQVNLTRAGKTLVNGLKSELSDTSATSSATTLTFTVGSETLTVYSDHINANTDIKVPVDYAENASLVEAKAIVYDSAIQGEFAVQFKSVSSDGVIEQTSVYGDNALLLTYIALAVALVACIVLPIVKYGKYGVTCAYSTLGYLIITGICFAFITEGVFEVTLGTVVVFLVGLLLVNLMNARAYSAIKAEFDLGKTVDSSVKLGMKKALFETVDVYAVLAIGAVALIIGVAGLHTLALQMLICIAAGAFCNLAWHRLINLLMLSTSKNKFKYFRFVREDDDDE